MPGKRQFILVALSLFTGGLALTAVAQQIRTNPARNERAASRISERPAPDIEESPAVATRPDSDSAEMPDSEPASTPAPGVDDFAHRPADRSGIYPNRVGAKP